MPLNEPDKAREANRANNVRPYDKEFYIISVGNGFNHFANR